MSATGLIARIAPVLFVLLWSTGFIGAKYGLPYAEPMTFLLLRMAVVVALLAALAVATRPRLLKAEEIGHSVVAGILVHGFYLGGVFTAIGLGLPAGLAALIAGLQPILTATLANRWLGERVGPLQWAGLALGFVGVVLVLHDRPMGGAASGGWIAAFVSLFAITLGTLYQKKFCSRIDWRSGNLVQYAAAGVLFAAGALLFETRTVQWTLPFVLALAWLCVVLSVGAVALLYWLIRHTAATRVASIFYLVPAVTALFAYVLFGERLDALSIAGMVLCAAGVVLANRQST